MKKEEKNKPLTHQIVDQFFVLKGWDFKDKDFYEKEGIVYGRHVGPAKKLLFLCDNNVEFAKERMGRVAKWADSNKLEWMIETVFKKWLELDKLKPREKEPYFREMKIIEKNNKKYCIDAFGKWLEFAGNLNEIEYR